MAEDAVTRAADLKSPKVVVEQPTARGSLDQTYASIDPQTGTLTASAVLRRQEILEEVRSWPGGAGVSTFAQALPIWLKGRPPLSAATVAGSASAAASTTASTVSESPASPKSTESEAATSSATREADLTSKLEELRDEINRDLGEQR